MADKINTLNHDDECWGPKAEAISIWHFDKWKVDKPEDVYTSICNFDLDFTDDVKKAEELILKTKAPERHRDFWKDLGHPDPDYTDSSLKLKYKDFSTFHHIVDYLGLQEHPEFDIKVKLFRQRPGQILPTHIDNYKKSHEEEVSKTALKAKRFAVALTEWDFGHYWHFGNAFWHQWKLGDCVHWDRTMAHGTANVGHTDRLTLQITGIPSEKTLELLKK